jgi:hypothetical protein
VNSTPDTLLDLALGAEDEERRRDAFVELLRSEHWRLVLAPHVISCQGFRIRGALEPDEKTFERAAEVIAESEDRLQRSLELAGARFSAALLSALARRMKTDLVEPALEHLRTAEGIRNTLLQRTLHEADPAWVKHSLAGPAIRRQLRKQDQGRIELMHWLADAGVLGKYLAQLREYPPVAIEEWSALGRAAVPDAFLFDLAMATLPHAPAPILYLLRFDPLPAIVMQRIMASARGEWVAAAIEICLLDGLDHKILIPLAELGIRLGGRSLSAATAWIGASKLAKQLLVQLGDAMEEARGRGGIDEVLWIRRNAPSGDRALEQGRRGQMPDWMDSAALVRQLRGPKVRDLVHEILSEPRDIMIDTVLRPLCAVNEEAAREVMALAESHDATLSDRARELRNWPDVAWPPEDSTQEIEFD